MRNWAMSEPICTSDAPDTVLAGASRSAESRLRALPSLEPVHRWFEIQAAKSPEAIARRAGNEPGSHTVSSIPGPVRWPAAFRSSE